MNNIHQMRNGLGVLLIYIKVIWWSLLFILIFAVDIAATWASFTWELWLLLLTIPLWVITLLAVWAYWDDTISPVWRDVFGGCTILEGRVTGKRVSKETISGYAGPYAGSIHISETKYHIGVGHRRFRVSKKIHNWFSEGDTVVIHYWPHSETVARVEMMSRGSPVKERPKDVYLSLLSQLEAEGGFVTFQHQEKENSWVQVLFFDEETQVNFGYPYDEDPNRLIAKRAISFPTGYALSEWEPQLNATFAGPRCSHSELANTIDALFTKLLDAPPNYVVEGRIEE